MDASSVLVFAALIGPCAVIASVWGWLYRMAIKAEAPSTVVAVETGTQTFRLRMNHLPPMKAYTYKFEQTLAEGYERIKQERAARQAERARRATQNIAGGAQ